MPESLTDLGVIPIAVIDREDRAVPLGDALLAGGLPCVEVTFRTPAAEAAIRALGEVHPEMLVGAGTVTSVAQARAAADAGARFVVMPGFDEATVAWCLEHGVPVVPGVMTPTEIGGARSAGLDLLKFFPADATGGSGWLRSIAGVFPEVRFIPTGGIGIGNLGEYLRLPNVAACGGSWIVHRRLVARGEFGEITRLASEAVGVVRAVRAEA